MNDNINNGKNADTSVNMPELLAPAGNWERMETAFRFGADAVYLGAGSMNLRSFADNFTFDELECACAYAHEREKRVYLTVNAFARDDDIKKLPELLEKASSASVDALIINDPGVLRTARKYAPSIPLHLSTQANTLNSEAAAFWYEQGIRRIILARELSFDDIKRIRENTPESLEFEMFVHGAMCVSYSGRCLLSNYIDGRDSNRGECVQPCRWSYEIRECGKDGEFFSIVQDKRGSYILNSKDLNLIDELPEIVSLGVHSLKIEGRMKSISYVATVVNAYRMALDALYDSINKGTEYSLPEGIYNELNSVSHRPYTKAYAISKENTDTQATESGGYTADAVICGVVLDYDAQNKLAFVRQRNRFFVGDTLEALSPGSPGRPFLVNTLTDEDKNAIESAPHPNQRIYISCDIQVKPGDLLRRRHEQ